MKSIKQQYIDLREGNITQANFMRNLRMTLPQYVTNVTSFEDSVRILKNKGILTEADTKSSEEGKWKTVTGKDLYAHFKEIDNLNAQEVLVGIDYEMQKNTELTKADATKIVIKNLKKNPIYYTAEDMSGVEGYEPEYISKSSKPEDWQMKPLEKNMGNVVDKKLGMQPVKGVEKPKKDSDKGGETNKTEKGVELMSLIAKTVRGLKKMDATGEKMKKITMKEARMNDFPGETKGKIAQQIMNYVDSNPTLKKYSNEITLQSNPDGFLRFGYWETLPSDAIKALELQFNITPDEIEAEEDRAGGVFYRLTPKHSVAKVGLGQDTSKLTKEHLMQMIREELAEITGVYGGDAMDAEDGSSYVNEAEFQSLDRQAMIKKIIIPALESGSEVIIGGETIKPGTGSFIIGAKMSKSNNDVTIDGEPIEMIMKTSSIDLTRPTTMADADIEDRIKQGSIQYPAGSRMDESIEKAVNEAIEKFRKGK